MYVADHESLGGLSFLDPNADPLQDWYYWTSRAGDIRNTTQQSTKSWSADIRTSRRLRGGYDLIMVAGGNAAINTIAMDLNIGMRLLWRIT